MDGSTSGSRLPEAKEGHRLDRGTPRHPSNQSNYPSASMSSHGFATATAAPRAVEDSLACLFSSPFRLLADSGLDDKGVHALTMSLKTVFEHVRDRESSLKRANAEVQIKLLQAARKGEQFRSQAQEALRRLQAEQDRVKQLNNRLTALLNAKEGQTKEREASLEAQLLTLKAENELLGQRLDQRCADMGKVKVLADAVTGYQQQIQEVEAHSTKTLNELENIRSELTDSRQRSERCSQQAQNIEIERRLARWQLTVAQEEIMALNKKLKEANVELVNMRSDFRSQAQRVWKLTAEVKSKADHVVAQQQESENERKTLDAELTASQLENERINDELESSSLETTNLKSEVERISNEYSLTRVLLAETRNRNEAREQRSRREMEQLNARLDALRVAYRQAHDDKDEALQRVRVLNRLVTELEGYDHVSDDDLSGAND